MPYESDLMLSVQVHSKKDKQEIWQMLRRLGLQIKQTKTDATIILTANDEEELAFESEIVTRAKEISGPVIEELLKTNNLNKIQGIIQKALNEQDAFTYNGRSSEGTSIAGDTAVEILKALQ